VAKAAFLVNIADLLHRPGARRREHVVGPVEAMRVMDTSVADGATASVDTLLEWVTDGVLATGTASTEWMGLCRRCLSPIGGRVEASFQELFEPRARDDGETYPLRGDRIDLGPLAREALLLELPLAPVCREDCLGLCPTCGADRNAGPCGCLPADRDPRWAGLEGLFEDQPPT
jgi:uncharacterized protein